MHRPTAAVLALLQCMAIFACQIKLSSEVPRLRRFIIGVPMFADDRFRQGQRRSVVGYDGQYRQMFEEGAADDDGCYNGYYSPQHCTAQLPTAPEKSQSAINNDAWWLAVIENTNSNNQHEMETKEAWRKYQWVLSCSQ